MPAAAPVATRVFLRGNILRCMLTVRCTTNCRRRENKQKKVHGMDMFDAELGYKAMLRFLEKYFETTGSDDVGALLGSMSTNVFSDGRPADPAIWEEWLKAVHDVTSEG